MLGPFQEVSKRFSRKQMLASAFVLSSLITFTFVTLQEENTPNENSNWLAGTAYIVSQIKVNSSQNETVRPRSIQILCLILAESGNAPKSNAITNTWAKRCDKHLFVYGNAKEIQSSNSSLHIPVPEGRTHLTAKVRFAFQYAYQAYNDSFDWILKCDDDTYVIVDNLRLLLSKSDPKKPGFLGFHMKEEKTQKHGYMSGGGGYVISSSALFHLINTGFTNGGCLKDGGHEDVEMGLCLSNSNVPVIPSLDADGKETFHPEPLRQYLYPPHPEWLLKYAWNQVPKFGSACCSKHSITFHHLSPEEMYVYEHLLYNTEVHKGE